MNMVDIFEIRKSLEQLCTYHFETSKDAIESFFLLPNSCLFCRPLKMAFRSGGFIIHAYVYFFSLCFSMPRFLFSININIICIFWVSTLSIFERTRPFQIFHKKKTRDNVRFLSLPGGDKVMIWNFCDLDLVKIVYLESVKNENNLKLMFMFIYIE